MWQKIFLSNVHAIVKVDSVVIIIIIIITNEKIKVMLSWKRCRGTLQDYNEGEISEWHW